MVDPQEELIIAAVLEALEGISVEAGYYSTPENVQRYDRTEIGRAAGSILLTKAIETKALIGNYWNCELNLEIEATIEVQEDIEFGVTTDRLLLLKQDDIEKALAAVDWTTLQAIFDRIEVAPFSSEDPNEPDDGILVRIHIRYGHDMNSTRTPVLPLG